MIQVSFINLCTLCPIKGLVSDPRSGRVLPCPLMATWRLELNIQALLRAPRRTADTDKFFEKLSNGLYCTWRKVKGTRVCWYASANRRKILGTKTSTRIYLQRHEDKCRHLVADENRRVTDHSYLKNEEKTRHIYLDQVSKSGDTHSSRALLNKYLTRPWVPGDICKYLDTMPKDQKHVPSANDENTCI